MGALNGNPNTEIQTPHTVQQIQELVNAMTIDIMHKLPPYSPTILQYSANTTINDFIQKNGIRPSRKTGYIRLADVDLNDERYEKLCMIPEINYIITIDGTKARNKYGIKFYYLTEAYVFTTGTPGSNVIPQDLFIQTIQLKPNPPPSPPDTWSGYTCTVQKPNNKRKT